MALSASYDFTLNRDELISRALTIIGAIGAGQTPTSDEISDASDVLNLMLKAWQADGMQLWTITQESVTPVASQYIYTIGTGGDIDVPLPPEIVGVYRRETATTTDVWLNRVSRDEWFRLPGKTNTGTPTQYYFDQKGANVTTANLYFWVAPDATFAADYTLEVLYQKPFDDMDATTNNLFFPTTWDMAVVYGLASHLAFEYGIPPSDQQRIQSMADKEKKRVMDWDTEHTSLFIQPDMRGGRRGWGWNG